MRQTVVVGQAALTVSAVIAARSPSIVQERIRSHRLAESPQDLLELPFADVDVGLLLGVVDKSILVAIPRSGEIPNQEFRLGPGHLVPVTQAEIGIVLIAGKYGRPALKTDVHVGGEPAAFVRPAEQ